MRLLWILKRRGVTNLKNQAKIDSLSQFLSSMPDIGRPLSVAEGFKFVKLAFFDGDSASYSLPTEFDVQLLPYLRMGKDNTNNNNTFVRLLNTFMDSNHQQARISVNMADVGTNKLRSILDSIGKQINQLFPKEN